LDNLHFLQIFINNKFDCVLYPEWGTSHHSRGNRLDKIEIWNSSSVIPASIDVRLKQISQARHYFLKVHTTAGTAIDYDRDFTSSKELAGYLPRAVFVGLFVPIAVNKISGSTLFFGMHALLFLAGIAIVLVWGRRIFSQPFIWLFILVAGTDIILRVLVTPNAGTLWRYLYGEKVFIICLGFVCSVSQLSARFNLIASDSSLNSDG